MGLFWTATFLCVALLFCSCGGPRDIDARSNAGASATGSSNQPSLHSTASRGDANQAVPVVSTRVERKAVAITISAVGTVESIATVQVHTQVNGQVTSIQFKEGDEVAKGQLIFTIDPRPFQAALKQAQAMLERDTATARNNQAERGRYDDLYKRGILPLDQYEAQSATAEAAKATVDVDTAAVETARLNLQYTNITAPIAGRTGSLGVHVGDIAHTTDTVPMIVINQMSPIYVTFSVPGRYLAEIRRYQALKPLGVHSRSQADVLPGAQPQMPPIDTPDVQKSASGSVENGRVVFIDNSVDATTGTIRLRGEFVNADRGLWPGLFEQVTLDLTTEERAIVVPASAVQVSQNGQYVYTIMSDCTTEMRQVTVERQQGDEIVISKGLTDGDQVVTDGTLRLVPGARVTIEGGSCGPPGE
jgi:multidrug efflux system membrane fusion protein